LVRLCVCQFNRARVEGFGPSSSHEH